MNEIRSVEGEAGVIASILLKPELVMYSDELKANYFTDKTNACIYSAVKGLVGKGVVKVDAYNITNLLSMNPATAKWNQIFTVEMLNEMFSVAPAIARCTAEDYKLIVSVVVDSAFRRETRRKLLECEALCVNPPADGENIQSRIYREIENIICKYQNVDDVKPLGSLADELWSEVQKGRDSSNFVDFKFPSLNQYCRLARGASVVISGREKRGKSLMLMNCAVDAARRGLGVLYIDTEISTPLFFMRLISHLTKIDFVNIRDGKYSPTEDGRSIQAAINWIKSKNLAHVYVPVVDDEKLVSTVKRYKSMHNLDFLCFDYLKSNGVYSLDAYKNSQAMGNTMDTLQNVIAGSMNLMCLAGAQSNKDGSMTGSAAIARNCSTWLYIDRKTDSEIQGDGGLDYGNMKLQVRANRIGMLHGDDEYISLTLDGNKCSFFEPKQPIRQEPY